MRGLSIAGIVGPDAHGRLVVWDSFDIDADEDVVLVPVPDGVVLVVGPIQDAQADELRTLFEETGWAPTLVSDGSRA